MRGLDMIPSCAGVSAAMSTESLWMRDIIGGVQVSGPRSKAKTRGVIVSASEDDALGEAEIGK